MKYGHFVFIAVTAVLLGACASRQARPPAASASSPVTKTIPVKEIIQTEETTADSKIMGKQIIGKPVPGGKFAQLKIGMNLKQVENLIGLPNRQWKQTGEKVFDALQSGIDSRDILYSYSQEGVLTFNYGEEYLLTRILVNRVE